MTRPSKTFLSILSLAVSLALPQCATAQHRGEPLEVPADSVPLFNGFAVSADLAGMIQYGVSDYGQFEGALRLNLRDTYFPIVEVGVGKASHDDDVTRLSYRSTAPYFRVGCDYNLMRDKHDDYRIYGGLRYAFSSFKYDVSHPGLVDPVWGDEAEYAESGVSCHYHWAEVAGGVDAKIAGPLHLGWSVRYRKRLGHDDGRLGSVWYVPGFGRSGSTRLGMTFNVSIDI